MIKDYIAKILQDSLFKIGLEKEIQFDKPKEEKFGDISTNIALLLAKELKSAPQKIATDILDSLQYDNELISKIEIAGAGFINFYLSDKFYKQGFITILKEKNDYGKSKLHKGRTANIEWVSANPTGPLHAGHGRQVSLGKAIANLLEWTGYEVTREYYYNDAGNQMNNLAKSVYARYMQMFDNNFPFPEDGYVGEYVKNIAKTIYDKKNSSQKNTDLEFCKKEGEKYNFNLIKQTLDKFKIHHDIFFNETSMYEGSDINKVLEEFRTKQLSYEHDGAVWLKMNAVEDYQKDKVIVKSSGEPTYRLPDIAYHINKLSRGYDLILDIFGSDHGDTYKEVLHGLKSLGYNSEKIKVIIHQMVTFKMGDSSFKMSKRSNTAYYLDDLIEDIGVDATQFFFVMRGANTHLDFDIELAKDQSEKNPVYYLQYAHARICGILRNADVHIPEYTNIDNDKIDLDLIQNHDEIKLLKVLSYFPEEVSGAANSYEPHRIITYLNEVAENFHRFYHNNRVIDIDNKEVSILRLLICLAAQQVLKNGFDIIGISAPERM